MDACGDRRGSIAGRQRHVRAGEDTCEPCAKAWSVYNRERKAARRGDAGACGDARGRLLGWHRHRDAGERPCSACESQRDAADAQRRAINYAGRKPSGACGRLGGTQAGVSRHHRAGEPSCKACAEASRRNSKRRHKQRAELRHLPAAEIAAIAEAHTGPPADADWHLRARCLDHPDPDRWYSENAEHVDSALAQCRRCPVLRECRDHALDAREEWGVWGGLSEGDLRRVVRLLPEPCGSHAGYQQHHRWGEAPCDACRRAHNAYTIRQKRGWLELDHDAA